MHSKVASFCGVYANTILTYTSGAGDADYLQRELIDYLVKYRVSFTLLHCWEVLKECDKCNSGKVPLFMQKRDEKKNKRYKSSSSSSFNTRELGEGSINLNTTVCDEEDEVEELCRSYMSKLLRIKNKELELKVAELEIRRMKNRQIDEAFYETSTDEELKASLRHRLFG
ncbi:hypothetical protein Tco_1465515 [Tanacetum coccineum]